MTAYAQEARLLGVEHFEPLRITAEEIQFSREQHLAALKGDEMLGAIAFEDSIEDRCPSIHIASLVVAPMHQRRGIGRRLVRAVVDATQTVLTVSTAVGNTPAIELYRQLGFVETTRRVVGSPPIEVVRFVRVASQFSGADDGR